MLKVQGVQRKVISIYSSVQYFAQSIISPRHNFAFSPFFLRAKLIDQGVICVIFEITK